MNKAALVLAVAEATGEDIEIATRMVEATIKVMMHTVASGEHVAVTGWGRMEPVIRPERPARNPQTGEPFTVPTRIAVRFNPADRFAEYVNDVRPLPARAADVELKVNPALRAVPAPQAPEQGAP